MFHLWGKINNKNLNERKILFIASEIEDLTKLFVLTSSW